MYEWAQYPVRGPISMPTSTPHTAVMHTGVAEYAHS